MDEQERYTRLAELKKRREELATELARINREILILEQNREPSSWIYTENPLDGSICYFHPNPQIKITDCEWRE